MNNEPFYKKINTLKVTFEFFQTLKYDVNFFKELSMKIVNRKILCKSFNLNYF